MSDITRYNCGEHLPGLQPIIVGPVVTTVPSVIIPSDPGNVDPPWLPQDPVDPPPNNPIISIRIPTSGIQDPFIPGVQFPNYPNSASALVSQPDANGQIFSTSYNISQTAPVASTTLVPNSKHTNIFSNIVAQEVGYFLDRHGVSLPWHEGYLFNLTNDKIRVSLRGDLSQAIERLHFPSGDQIPYTSVLNAIKKHLLEGTLDQFNPEYFISLANKQRNDPILVISRSPNQGAMLKAGLEVATNYSVRADASSYIGYEKSLMNRQRRLNEDIDAKIQLEVNGVCSSLPVYNAGICLVGSGYVEIGDGNGYYIQVQTDECEALPMQTVIASSTFILPEPKETALKTISEFGGYVITASSLTSNHELSSYSPPALSALYFAIELSSVVDLPTNNPLVNLTSARYTLLTNQSEIDRHTLNNGLSVSRVNIDYNDPIFKYMSDTSTLSLMQNDITFRNFSQNRSVMNSTVFTRTIPFGLVVVPGSGTNHNPFNGRSKITEYDEMVVRTLTAIQWFNQGSPLQESSLFQETGQFKVGLVEEFDTQARSFKFAASAYSIDTPSPSTIGFGNMVSIMDSLIALNSSSQEFNWFDVFSRMSVREFSEFLYDSNHNLFSRFSAGLRNGIKFRHVLHRDLDLIPTVEGSNPILLPENRQ